MTEAGWPSRIDLKTKQLFAVITLITIFFYFGVFLCYALLLIMQPNFARDNLKAWLATNQLFECISAFIFTAIVYAVPTLVFIASHAFPKIIKISMDQNLSGPKYKTLILLGFASFKLNKFLCFPPEDHSFSTRLIMLLVVLYLCHVVCLISVNISLVLTVSWISMSSTFAQQLPWKVKKLTGQGSVLNIIASWKNIWDFFSSSCSLQLLSCGCSLCFLPSLQHQMSSFSRAQPLVMFSFLLGSFSVSLLFVMSMMISIQVSIMLLKFS